MKIQGMLSTGVGVLPVSKVRGVGGQHRIELLEEEKRERTTPIVAFAYGFLTQEKVPQHTPFHFLWVSSKILVSC